MGKELGYVIQCFQVPSLTCGETYIQKVTPTGEHEITKVDSEKELGITIDKNLTFSTSTRSIPHISGHQCIKKTG